MEFFIQFIFKLLDNMLGTFKTIYLSKGKNFLAALFAATSNVFYLITIRNMANSDSNLLIFVLSAAVFIGTYSPGLVIKKTRRDDMYMYNITAPDMKSGVEFADKIRDNNIPIKTYKVYDSNMVKTLACDIYCKTKQESTVVDGLIGPGFKYNVSVPVKF